MTYTNNIPAAGDLISASQSQIQGNFQFLASTAGNSSNGYYRFPNGLIMQWGQELAVVDNTEVAFPVTFTTAVYSVTTTVIKNSANAEDFAYVKSVATTTVGSFFVKVSGDNLPYAMNWMAIGV